MLTVIGTAMLKVMKDNELDNVQFGDNDILLKAFKSSGAKSSYRSDNPHGIRMLCNYVLTTLGYDDRFVKQWIKSSHGDVRRFIIKE